MFRRLAKYGLDYHHALIVSHCATIDAIRRARAVAQALPHEDALVMAAREPSVRLRSPYLPDFADAGSVWVDAVCCLLETVSF